MGNLIKKGEKAANYLYKNSLLVIERLGVWSEELVGAAVRGAR